MCYICKVTLLRDRDDIHNILHNSLWCTAKPLDAYSDMLCLVALRGVRPVKFLLTVIVISKRVEKSDLCRHRKNK